MCCKCIFLCFSWFYNITLIMIIIIIKCNVMLSFINVTSLNQKPRLSLCSQKSFQDVSFISSLDNHSSPLLPLRCQMTHKSPTRSQSHE